MNMWYNLSVRFQTDMPQGVETRDVDADIDIDGNIESMDLSAMQHALKVSSKSLDKLFIFWIFGRIRHASEQTAMTEFQSVAERILAIDVHGTILNDFQRQ